MARKVNKSVEKVQYSTDSDINITPDSVCFVTIYEQGSFKTRTDKASSKKDKRKMLSSWVLSETKHGKYQSFNGIDKWYKLKPGEKPTNWFKARNNYTEPEYFECIRKIRLNSDAVEYYTSIDACPYKTKIGLERWRKMSKKARLEANIAVTADFNKFEYEVVN